MLEFNFEIIRKIRTSTLRLKVKKNLGNLNQHNINFVESNILNMLLQNASRWQVFGGNLDVLEGKLYYLLQKCRTLYRFLNILLAIFLHENTLVKRSGLDLMDQHGPQH